MITVEVKGNGCLLKHINIIRHNGAPNYDWEYTRPGDKILLTGTLYNFDIVEKGVTALILNIVENIKKELDKRHEAHV